MEHSHSNTHSHAVTINKNNMNVFLVGIGLNMAFVVAEVVAGFAYNSMALLTDAGHNLSDVASLVISLVAFWIAKKQSSAVYTYGYKKNQPYWQLLLTQLFFSLQLVYLATKHLHA